MTNAILFDLDDTLLQTNMGEFIPAYFETLGAHMAHLAPARSLITQLQRASQAMQANRDPGRTLKSVFDEHFYAPLGATEAAWAAPLDHFYKHTFPRLQSVTQQKPQTPKLIHWCQKQGAALAIATNPLFPKIATHQRLRWAGLSLDDFIFVSTFEDFHFSKPSLSYYAECLGRLGWPKGPIPMIGDNLTHDLLPMEKLGHPTFWVDPDETQTGRRSGALEDVQPFLQALPDFEPPDLAQNLAICQSILRATPAVLDTWSRQIPEEAFRKRPASHEWSLVEVFWHLADMETAVFLPQWRQLLQDAAQPLPIKDTEAWAEERTYIAKDPSEAVQKLVQTRCEALSLISELIDAGKSDNRVHHPVFTQTKTRELIAFSVQHDIIHLRQCFALLELYKII